MDANPDPAPPSRLDRLTLIAGYLTVVVALTFALVLAVQGRWLLAGVFTAAAAVSMFGMWHLCGARRFKGRQLGAEVQEGSASWSGDQGAAAREGTRTDLATSGSCDPEVAEPAPIRREAKEGPFNAAPVGRESAARIGP